MAHFDKSVQLELDSKEAHHRKSLMNGVGVTIKRVVLGLVKSKKNHDRHSGRACNGSFKGCGNHSINLPFPRDEIIEPSVVKVAPCIQGTLDTHYVKHSFISNGVCFL